MPRHFIAFVTLLLAGSLLAAPAEARLDPRLDWHTVESAHFLVLFSKGNETVAERAVAIAEEAHRRLVPELRWEPQEKTRLVLADVSDAANGMATPFPFNRIVVYLSPPLEEPFAITDSEEWLRLVITHEYAHILHLDNVQEGPADLRRLFGRLYFPNLFEPNWLIEGLATYEETKLTRGGRGRSSYTEMLLRTATLEGRFPSLAQAGTAPDSWPAGELPYLFGVKFYQHLVEKYGPDLPGKYSRRYAGRSFPFLVDSTAKATFASTFPREWRLWQEELQRTYQSQNEALTAAGLTPVTPLTATGDHNLFPALSPDGKRLAYTSRTADRVSSLLLADADGQHSRPLLRRAVAPGNAALAWLADGSGLVYAKIEADRFDNLFSDLYRLDLASNTEQRLTTGLRAGSPDLAPLSGEIVFTAGAAAANRLAVVTADGSNLRYLSPPDTPRLFATPRWSPDGQRIAVSVKETDGRFVIQILDRGGNVLDTLPDFGAINASPAWSGDGATLFFTSDRSGIYNIHAYQPASRNLFQVTNRLGGAFTPQPTPDGQGLLLADYSSAGFDLARIALHPESWQPVVIETTQPAASTLTESAPPAPAAVSTPISTSAPASVYVPWNDLRPHYWLPWFGADEAGAQLGLISSGSDAIDRHSWTATATWGTASHHPAYSLLYRYDGFLPTVQLLADDQSVPYATFFRAPGAKEETYWERRRNLGLDLILPSDGLWSRHFLIPGLRYERFSGATDLPAGLTPPEEGKLVGVRLAYQFNNSVRPGKAISAEDGRSLGLASDHNRRSFGGDFDLSRYTLDWHEFINLPWSDHHILATRLFGGIAQGDLLERRAFQLGGDSLGDLLQELDDQNLALRGYPRNLLRGQRAVLASAEYRFPLRNLETGSGNGPIFFRRLHGALFGEGGEAFDHGGVKAQELRTAAGAEVRCDLQLGYVLPATLRLVVAKGFDEGGEKQLYLSVWMVY